MPWGWVVGIAIGVCMIVAASVWLYAFEWARKQEKNALRDLKAGR